MPRQDPRRPRVVVLGLWHLGVVIAACLADAGFPTLALDPDPRVIGDLRAGRPPVSEPGLAELLRDMRERGTLDFATAEEGELAGAEVVWIAFDTPVRDDDSADSEWVLDRAVELLVRAPAGALVVVSSQLPVGSVSAMAERLARAGRDDLRFSCVPENLRLGDALRTFRDPERFVVGSPEGEARAALETLLAPFGAPLEWMAIESAEMTKHALNAFLATSVAFINEIATICEAVGADAAEVSRGLMSEQRIGPRAYLRPGDAFAGGTLARDISFLAAIARENGLRAPLVEGVTSSNELHRGWSLQALLRLLAAPERRQQPHPLAGRRVALWGLTYKPGTDTLRRSSALELARSLVRAGAEIRAHDPTIKELPPPDAAIIELAGDPLGALRDADALVLCTPWPEYRTIEAGEVRAAMAEALVVDPGGHLLSTLGHDPHVRYARVGVLPR